MIRVPARFRPAAAVPFALLAAACSTAGNYPSLEQRPVERVSGTAQPVAPGQAAPAAAPLPPASATLPARLDALLAAAQDADARFQAARPAAERAVASAGPVASGSWSSASVALAGLETSRSHTMAALAELDGLYAEARSAAPVAESADAGAIAAVRMKVESLIEAQDGVLDALSARLRG